VVLRMGGQGTRPLSDLESNCGIRSRSRLFTLAVRLAFEQITSILVLTSVGMGDDVQRHRSQIGVHRSNMRLANGTKTQGRKYVPVICHVFPLVFGVAGVECRCASTEAASRGTSTPPRYFPRSPCTSDRRDCKMSLQRLGPRPVQHRAQCLHDVSMLDSRLSRRTAPRSLHLNAITSCSARREIDVES
jgi:hypothetical protein